MGVAPTPLDDLRVIEVSDRIAGAYCGKLLNDAGADVVKVEPAEGDPLRRRTVTGAALDGADAPLFSYLNAGKRSATTCSAELLAGADIVVVTASRSGARNLGIDPDEILATAPGCVVVTISDFGWTGPWAQRPATEFTLQAVSGLTGFRGDPAGPPISIGGDLGEYMGGAWAALGALALSHRVRSGGTGGHLDMSMLEAVTLMQSGEWLHSALLRVPPVRRSVEVPSVEPAKDGYVGISMVTGQQWLDFAAMVECPELTEIDQLQFQIGRWDYRDWIRERIDPWLRERTVAEIVELGQLFRLPVAPIGNGATIPDMDHLVQRGVYVDHPAGFRQPRPPWLMSQARPAPIRPSPRIGDADGQPAWAPRHHSVQAPDCGLPLTGMRIVDFTAFWAGPAATHALAAFGADVIKVESIQRPDGIRYSGGMRKDVDDWWEYGWVFHAMNTNKRSVTLDLQSDDGLQLVKQLIGEADAVVENFSPRVMEHFGLGAEVLLDLNPRLVMMRMPAFGLTGPWRERVGFAPTMEQIAGLAWVTGLPDAPPVAPRGACDPLAGAHAAFALLAARALTDRTGRGQLVEVPMIETVLNVTAVQTIEYEVFGRLMGRRGNRGHGTAAQDIYRCAGEDQWIAVTVGTDAHRTALEEIAGDDLSAWLAGQHAGDAAEQLAAAGVPAAEVISPSLVTDNPQLRHRGFFEQLEHPSTGANLYPCPPFTRLDGAQRWLLRTPPTLGEHNAEVLTGICQLTDADMERLAAQGVIGTRPKGV